jgi:hypothetical protein
VRENVAMETNQMTARREDPVEENEAEGNGLLFISSE